MQPLTGTTQPPVQPRLRGELFDLIEYWKKQVGSTPLARGTHLDERSRGDAIRFNPACAGNSILSQFHERRQTVQPRLRGELMEPMFYEGDIVGSTPLARGTPNQFAITVIKIRFNPACAGNSSRHRRQLEKSTVQPRLRGELRRKF